MGSRGPAGRPTELKLLAGETRPSRVNYDTPRPRARRPIRPPDLSPAALAVWRRVIREYGDSGVLTALDSDVLRVYCEAVARYSQAAVMLATTGPLVKGARHGELVKNPLHQVVRENADLVRLHARELGLTPSARSSVRSVEAVEQIDELERWERRRRTG